MAPKKGGGEKGEKHPSTIKGERKESYRELSKKERKERGKTWMRAAAGDEKKKKKKKQRRRPTQRKTKKEMNLTIRKREGRKNGWVEREKRDGTKKKKLVFCRAMPGPQRGKKSVRLTRGKEENDPMIGYVLRRIGGKGGRRTAQRCKMVGRYDVRKKGRWPGSLFPKKKKGEGPEGLKERSKVLKRRVERFRIVQRFGKKKKKKNGY